MKRLCIVAAAAILLAAGSLYAAGDPGDSSWLFVGFTKYRDAVYLDRNRLTKTPTDGVLAFCRITPSGTSRYSRQIEAEFRKADKPFAGFRSAEIFSEIDCRKKAIRFLGVKYFNGEGEILHAHEEPGAPWTPIKSGSLWDSLRKNACAVKPL